jgi:hypothetical protein
MTASAVSPTTPVPIATVGPWTVHWSCNFGPAVNITGPGSYYATTIGGAPGPSTSTETHINNGPLGEAGFTAGSAANKQMSVEVQLISGATMYELRIEMTETGSGIHNPCTLTGSATPVT